MGRGSKEDKINLKTAQMPTQCIDASRDTGSFSIEYDQMPESEFCLLRAKFFEEKDLASRLTLIGLSLGESSVFFFQPSNDYRHIDA